MFSFRRLSSGLLQSARRWPRTYWYLWFGTLVNRLGSFVGPFLAFYLTRERGLSVDQAGLAVSCFGAGQMVAATTGGILADRKGRRFTLLISLFGGAAVMLWLGFTSALQQIVVLVFLLGLLGDMYRPAVSASIADLFPRERRLEAYALLYWAINLGFSAAPILAGLLSGLGYRWLFVGDAITTLLYGCVVYALVPETKPVSEQKSTSGGLGTVLRDGVFMTFVALQCLLSLIIFQVSFALASYLVGQGLREREYGSILAVNGLLIIFTQPFINRWIARFDRSFILALAALLTGFGFSLHGVARSVPLHMLAVGVWTLGEICWQPSSSTVVAELAPVALRGRYQGLFAMSWGISAWLAPLVSAQVLKHWGASVLWSGCALLGIIVAIGVLLSAGARRRRIAAGYGNMPQTLSSAGTSASEDNSASG